MIWGIAPGSTTHLKVCPKEVHLTDAIAEVGREVTLHAAKKFFGGN